MFLLFSKKLLFEHMGHFGPENDVSLKLWICSNYFFKISHNERGQEVCKNYVVFSEKLFIGGKWVVLDPKMLHDHNSVSIQRFFYNIFTVKEAKRYIKIILMVFQKKKSSFRVTGSFCAQKWCAVITLDPLQQFLLHFAQWQGLRGTWNSFNGFSEKKNLGEMGHFESKNDAWS